MQIYLATVETSNYLFEDMPDDYIEFGLASFLYIKDQNQLELIVKKCKNVLIDSGAHSIHSGKNVSPEKYIKDYIDFIKRNTDNPKIQGFFELDFDPVYDYEVVKKYQKRLLEVSDKIIPVWHKGRGVDDFHEMCSRFSGKRIAITSLAYDVAKSQYNSFINYAHSKKCNIHLLAMTKYGLLKDLNLHKDDSIDSSSWKQTGIFGGINLINKECEFTQFKGFEGTETDYKHLIGLNCISAVRIQRFLKNVDNSIYFNKGDG
jgi:hypothetical protein